MNNASQDYEWFLARDGQRYGPITNEDLRKLASTGHVKAEDLIWRQGFDEWVAASTIPGLISDDQALGDQTLDDQVIDNQDANTIESGDDYSQFSHDSSEFSEQPQTELRADPSQRIEPEARPEPIEIQQETEFLAEPVIDRPVTRNDPAQGQTVGYMPEMQRPRKSFTRRFFNFVLFLLIIGGIAIFALPAVIPADFIREHIARIIKEETGRTLSVRGKSTFTILPYPGVSMHDVALSNPPSMGGDPLLHMSAMDIQLKLLPLFEQKIEIKRVTLKQPKLSLRLDGQGQNNWTFAKNKQRYYSDQKKTAAIMGSAADKPSSIDNVAAVIGRAFFGPVTARGQLTNPKLKDIKFEEVRIIGGSVLYQDEKTGFSETFETMNAKINLTTLSQLLIVDGSGFWNKKKIDYALSLKSPQSLMRGKKVPYTLTLVSTLFTTYLSGELSWAGGWYLTGESSDFQVQRSVRDLASWLGHDITPGSGMESFSITGDFTAQSQKIAITNATVTLDSTSANGEASLLLSGKRPYVKANLTSDTLNLNPYFNEAPLRDTSLTRSNFRYAQQQGGTTGSFSNVNQDAFNRDGGYSTGGITQDDTNGEQVAARPINTFASSLKLFDADIELAADKVIIEKMLIGKSRVAMKVRKGVLNAKISEMSLYSGNATGHLKVSSPGLIPEFSGEMKILKVSALPLLKDSHAFDWLSGIANIDFIVSSRGHSKKQIMSALEGKGRIELVDGALEGVDLSKMVKELKRGKLSGLNKSSSERTPFEKFDGAFSISNGIINNADTKLTSENLTAKGNGQIDLTRDWVDYRVEHKIITRKKGDENLIVPVRIKGPLEKPDLSVDLNETIAKNQKAIIKGINQAAKVFKKLKKKNKKIDFESLIQEALSGGKRKSQNDDASQ